jgi:hypothetical protein
MSRKFLDRHRDGRTLERLTKILTPVDQLSRTQIGHPTDFVRQENDLNSQIYMHIRRCLSPRSSVHRWLASTGVFLDDMSPRGKRKRSVRTIARRDAILISLLSSFFLSFSSFILQSHYIISVLTTHSQRHNVTTSLHNQNQKK